MYLTWKKIHATYTSKVPYSRPESMALLGLNSHSFDG